MPSSRFTYLWIRDGIPARRLLGGPVVPLEERLYELADDDERTVEALVASAAQTVFEWALEHDPSWSSERAGVEFEQGVAELEERHGWRGPLANFLDSLRQAWSATQGAQGLAPGAAFSEEAGAWIWSAREDLENWPDLAGEWTGEALVPGRRLPSRAALARHAAEGLEADETILVVGAGEALVAALREAARVGKRPRVLCAEGQPLLDGRRLARALPRGEVRLTLVHDAALVDCVSEADRIWIASEALGARGLLSRSGTRRVAREALDEGVPLEVLASADTLLPGGELALPRWMDLDPTLLWVDAPEEIELRTRCLEEVPFELAGQLVTEKGRESAEELFLRALRLERSPRCADGAPRPERAPLSTPSRYAPDLLRPAARGAQPKPTRSAQREDSNASP